MKRTFFYILFSLMCLFNTLCMGQVTNVNGSWVIGGNKSGRLSSVEIRNDGVVVTIELKAAKALNRLDFFSTSNTFIAAGDLNLLKLKGVLVDGVPQDCGYDRGWGWNNVAAGEIRSYQLFFEGSMPTGVTKINIVDYGDSQGNHGYCFSNVNINNPRKNYFDFNGEYAVKEYADQNNDGICGIYEDLEGTGAKLGCVKSDDQYYLVYIDSPSNYQGRVLWKVGDVKARLRNTASGILKADWYNAAKQVLTGYVAFDGVSMKVKFTSGEELVYLKTYPTSTPGISSGSGNTQQGSSWTGTGFALRNGYIITNHHVVKGASSIVVQGVNGSSVEYKAEVVSVDKNNDLALIRINDYRFDGFGPIPYAIRNSMCDVGEDVFVLGYPMTSYMGEEIKLTNGIVSSKSGYQGDITTYQISAPVQPGNSGGPMFDKNGNIVGVVNAGIPGADNVGYAIKATYLSTLVNSSVSSTILPSTNSISDKSLPEKVKAIRNYVFYIKCK